MLPCEDPVTAASTGVPCLLEHVFVIPTDVGIIKIRPDLPIRDGTLGELDIIGFPSTASDIVPIITVSTASDGNECQNEDEQTEPSAEGDSGVIIISLHSRISHVQNLKPGPARGPGCAVYGVASLLARS